MHLLIFVLLLFYGLIWIQQSFHLSKLMCTLSKMNPFHFLKVKELKSKIKATKIKYKKVNET